MAHRIAVSTLNASTVDIMNVIRANASLAYQNSVPAVQTAHDIPKVGEVIYGTPAFSNEFINALINRIALVRVQSATFNNPYERLKKGYLDYGESVEEIFVDIAKVFEFSQEKAENRELKQYKPNVHSAFHTMNWRVIYPVSISDEELRMAFLSAEGVTNLIAKIVDSVYTAANYDEYLLFKYMIIKTVSAGGMKPVAVDPSDAKNYAKAFRGTSNMLPFMKSDYNAAGVKNTTPRERQVIFMDAQFNADFDVDVLSAAFNMEKADFMGSLFLIDDWSTFDNERWTVIRENSDGIEEVTSTELTLMQSVKAILVDEEWFQVYDNLTRFAEKFVASGLRWNYFYHTWKTVSWSPYANAVVFVVNTTTTTNPSTITYVVESVDKNGSTYVIALVPQDVDSLADHNMLFVQTEALTQRGVAIQPYGAVFIPTPDGLSGGSIGLVGECNGDEYTGTMAVASAAGVYTITIGGTVANGDKITINGTTVTLDATSGASANAAATAVRTALGSDSTYSISGSGANVILTEKSGKYGSGMPSYSIESTLGTLTAAVTTNPQPIIPGTTITMTKQA